MVVVEVPPPLPFRFPPGAEHLSLSYSLHFRFLGLFSVFDLNSLMCLCTS
jgi:hypothetical protein